MGHLKLMTRKETKVIEEIMLKVNRASNSLFKIKGLILYDFKLEFGRLDKKLVGGDEIS